MMMGNIALSELEVIAQFDLKGSKVGRKVHKSSVESIQSLYPHVVYKDQDFENFIGHIAKILPTLLQTN